MINELCIANDLLNGVKFRKTYFSSAYVTLIRYYKDLGLNKLDIKEKILEWELKYGHKRYFDLTEFIDRVYSSDEPFRKDTLINITKDDVLEINKRFEKNNIKKIALALLCYAKLKANKNGIFYINFRELAEWVDIDTNNIHSRYMKKLQEWGYIEKLKSEKNVFTWKKDDNKQFYTQSKIMLKVDFSNECIGNWALTDNDLSKLFNDIFVQ